ncbi:serine/threonine-protein kinase [Mycolicibacterium baixiangningiae]|uniref:serine/threonine-protein kinase n=1 Tax=Mycolicibacterium baixiangningiae TaxID=2761578 RepID=UPI0018681803|nr:serine/threonine-protein kinase [Mycolicibacterium baixiangningiae]
MLVPGDRFEGYVVDRLLGHGGRALVYRAHEWVEPDRIVALKVLHERRRGHSDLARLHREFDLGRSVDHPHVVTMYDAGPDWLAMDFLDGGPLTNVVTMSERLAALGQIADALDHIHRRGIVHCDVKPTNILTHKDFRSGGAVLIDFGAAYSVADEVTEPPTRVEASLPYSAPELLTGRAPTAAVDEYALACTAVEVICGAPPFRTKTAMELMDAHLRRPPPQLSRKLSWIPRAFDSILAKALAKNPESRYQSCEEMIRLLSRTLY